jgi:hypothetical protein
MGPNDNHVVWALSSPSPPHCSLFLPCELVAVVVGMGVIGRCSPLSLSFPLPPCSPPSHFPCPLLSHLGLHDVAPLGAHHWLLAVLAWGGWGRSLSVSYSLDNKMGRV